MNKLLACLSIAAILMSGCTNESWVMPTTQNSKYMFSRPVTAATRDTHKFCLATIIHFRPETPDNITVKAIFRTSANLSKTYVVANSFSRAPKTIVLKSAAISNVRPYQNCYVDILLYKKEDLNTPVDSIAKQYFHTAKIGSDDTGKFIYDSKINK